MKKNRRLTPEALVLRMNEAGWSVQANGLVLCPTYGAALTLSADGCRTMLKLNTGWRTVLDISGLDVVCPPPEVTVDGVRLLSFERADLRHPVVLRDAAQLIRDLGETEGVLTLQGGYRDSVGVRTGGVGAVLERPRPQAPREVRFIADPLPPTPGRHRSPGLIPALIGMTMCVTG